MQTVPNREWYAKNREKILASVRAYQDRNRAAISAKRKVFYEQNKALILSRQREYREKNREKIARLEKDIKLRKAYGISLAEWEQLFLSQGRRCAICSVLEHGGRGWSTDHDHVSGVIRGILCHRCNIGLGYFKDSPEAAQAAAEYLLSGGKIAMASRKKGRKK